MKVNATTNTSIYEMRSSVIVKELASSLNTILPKTCHFHDLWIQLEHSKNTTESFSSFLSNSNNNATRPSSLGIIKGSSLPSPKRKSSSKERCVYTGNFIAVQRDLDWLQSKLDSFKVGDVKGDDENELLALFQQVHQKKKEENSLKLDLENAKVEKQSILKVDRIVQELRLKVQNLEKEIGTLKVEGNYYGLNHEEVFRARRDASLRDWNFEQEDLRQKLSKNDFFFLSLSEIIV